MDFRLQPISGGCINQTFLVEMASGHRCFLKFNRDPPPGLFEAEAEGLRALDSVGQLRLPQVLWAPSESLGGKESPTPSILLLEYIEPGRPGPAFFRRFGRALATLHAEAGASSFGFHCDNYLGSAPQPNGWTDDWIEFWRSRRLGHQLDWARGQGTCDAEMDRLGQRLLDRLDDLLLPPRRASLVHGDLWSGNFLCDQEGNPVLIDPAVYYGTGEAELAMTQLFGGFPSEFYSAYYEVQERIPGDDVRLDLYRLYHLLNHFNLFGAGYRSACLAILRRYAA